MSTNRFEAYSTSSVYVLRITVNGAAYYFHHRKMRPRHVELVDDIDQASAFHSAYHAKDEATIHLTTANNQGYGVVIDEAYILRLLKMQASDAKTITMEVGQCVDGVSRTPLCWHPLQWSPDQVYAL